MIPAGIQSNTYTYNTRKILQTCFFCSRPVEIDKENADPNERAIFHIVHDDSTLSIHHMSHLGCARRAGEVFGDSLFAWQPITYLCRGQVRIDSLIDNRPLELSTVHEELCNRAQEDPLIATKDSNARDALSTLLKSIKERISFDDEKKLQSKIETALANSAWDPYPYLLLSAGSYGSLPVLKIVQIEPYSRTIDPDVIDAALSHADKLNDKAAAHGNMDLLRLIPHLRPDSIGCAERIRALADSPVASQELNDLIFPRDQFPGAKDNVSWAVGHLWWTGKEEKVAHLMPCLRTFHPIQFQDWLETDSIHTFCTLETSKRSPLSPIIRGEFFLGLIQALLFRANNSIYSDSCRVDATGPVPRYPYTKAGGYKVFTLHWLVSSGREKLANDSRSSESYRGKQ